MKPAAISLLSGGLDSSVALALALKTHNVVMALTFDYGQRAAKNEIVAARDICAFLGVEHKIIDLPWLAVITKTALVNDKIEIPSTDIAGLDDMAKAVNRARSVWVPNRNGLMCNIAACYADAVGAKAIVAGFNAEEGVTFSDNKPSFVDAMNSVFEYSTQVHPSVISPTLYLNKKQIAVHAVDLNIKSFWCCYHGGDNKMCGRCESCVRTIRAFKEAGYMNYIKSMFNEGLV